MRKTAALNSNELYAMIDAAEVNNRFFTCHLNRRRDKDYCIVKKVIDDNMIGIPFFIESRVQGGNGIPSDRRRSKKHGGGMLLDWGVHLIDQILMMVNSNVVQIYSQIINIHYDVDDNLKVYLKFDNGINALLEVSTTCFQPLPRWHIMGSEGTLSIIDKNCAGAIGTVNN